MMENIDFNAVEMKDLNCELEGHLESVDDVLNRQMEFCRKHLVGKYFFIPEDDGRQICLCFTDVLGGNNARRGVLLRYFKASYNYKNGEFAIGNVLRHFDVVARVFNNNTRIEVITFESFESIHTSTWKQISEDVRKFHLANPTTPKDGISQLEEGE